MNKKDPTEVLNNNMEFLVDYLKREFRCLGKMNGLSESQISDMEREFIARLAFAAIIGDEKEDDCESCPAKNHCSFKESDKPEELPDYVIKALSFVKDYCLERDCDDCIFFNSEGECKIKYTPNEWRI